MAFRDIAAFTSSNIQSARYDAEAQKWWVTSGLPDFWAD